MALEFLWGQRVFDFFGLDFFLNGQKKSLDSLNKHESLTAFSAAWGVQDVEAVFAVLPSFELVEDPVRELPEALRTHEAGRTVKLAVGVDNLRLGLKPEVATGTAHTVHIHRAEKKGRYT